MDWDIQKVLSANGIEFLLKLLEEYQPEPWEATLRQMLIDELRK